MTNTDNYRDYPDIDNIISGETSQSEKIDQLETLLADERAMQRAATESNMVGDNDNTGSKLRALELALESLGRDAEGPEDNQAATL